MDPELQELLALLDRIGDDDAPSTEELTDARRTLAAATREAAGADEIDLEVVRALRDSVSRIDAELAARETAAEARAAEVAELLEGLEDDDTADDAAADGDADGGDTAVDGDAASGAGDGDTADDVVASGDGDATGDGDGATVAADATADADATREAVAASLSSPAAQSAINRARARRTRASRTTRDAGPDDLPSRVRVANAGPAIGDRVPDTMADVGQVFASNAHRTTRGRQTLVSLSWEYPEDRRLVGDTAANTRLLDRVMLPAITAAGGICEPLPADFSHPICGDRGRPIRDSLPRFGASRGGVRYAPSATVADLESSITVWTEATDADPSDQTKDCPAVNCEDEDSAVVSAIVRCLTVGNFQARFSPEFWASRLDLSLVAHDRIAEQTLYNTMVGLATAVTGLNPDGNTLQAVFLTLDRAIAGLRSRHRLMTTRMTMVAPMWLRDALRASFVRQAGRDGGSTDLVAVADAVIGRFFSDRMVDPVWSPDLDVFGAQADGPVLSWPGDDATMLLYPQGTYFFLDGGTLDLGTEITDSTLNAQNNRQAFVETFEQVAFRGCEALAVTAFVGEDCVCDGDIT